MGDFHSQMQSGWKGSRKNLPAASAVQVEEWASARRDAQPQTVRCGLCDWDGAQGTAGECREAALEHRRLAHPETIKPRRKRSSAGRGPDPGPKPMYKHTVEGLHEARVRGAREAAKSKNEGGGK